jgi:RNA polymerase sigma-70 factor (ECF subfamily)
MDETEKSLFDRLTWTRRLAAELVTDAGLAEDLVQEAWLQYLTRPPRTTRSLNGWFATVLRNLARQEGRRGRVRADHASDVAREDTSEATVELVARAQAQRTLVSAVLELDLPVRDVVLLRYFEELESPAIARRLGVPASTVRTRLQRGMAELRRKLDAGGGSRARDWLAALLPLLPRPERLQVSPATPVATATAAAPALWSWTMIATLGAVGLVAAVLVTRDGRRGDLHPTASERAAALSPADPAAPTADVPLSDRRSIELVTGEAPDERAAGTAALEDSPPAAEAAAPVSYVQVLVDGEPALRGTALLNSSSKWIAIEPGARAADELRLPVDPEGPTLFEGVDHERGAVGYQPYVGAVILQRSFERAEDGAPITFKAGTGRLEGRAWDADGRPAAGVEILLGMRIDYDYGAVRAKCSTDAGGRFAFDALPAGGYWVYSGDESAGNAMRAQGKLARGEVRSVDVGRPTGRILWTGRLVDAMGEPVVPARPGEDNELEFQRLDLDEGDTYFPVDLSGDGSFRIELEPGDYAVRRRTTSRATAQVIAERLRVSEAGDRELVLRGTRVHGTALVASTGRPFDPREGYRRITLKLQADDNDRHAYFNSYVGSGGRFVFHGVGPGRWVVAAEGRPDVEDTVLLIGAGDRERLVDVLVR